MRNYYDPQYSKFRAEVRKRDNYMCRWPACGATRKLQVHHIRRWADFPILRYQPSNGITLCKTHHKLIKGNEDCYIELFTKIINGSL